MFILQWHYHEIHTNNTTNDLFGCETDKWCQATCHNLIQCWLRSRLPSEVTKPQCVKPVFLGAFLMMPQFLGIVKAQVNNGVGDGFYQKPLFNVGPTAVIWRGKLGKYYLPSRISEICGTKVVIYQFLNPLTIGSFFSKCNFIFMYCPL